METLHRDGVSITSVTRAEFEEIVPYMKYTDYMLEKLSVELDYPATDPVVVKVLKVTDFALRAGFREPMSSRGAGLCQTWTRTHAAAFGAVNLTHGEPYVFVAVTKELETRIAESLRRTSLRGVAEQLRGRFRGMKFPSVETWQEFVLRVAGMWIEGASHNPILKVWMESQTWKKYFPELIRAKVDLTGWCTTATAVVAAFAKDRRTTVGKVCSLLKVKI